MNRKLSRRWHAPLWLGGVFLALLPFFIAIGFDGPRAPWVKGAGNFGGNVILAIWWALGGATLGGMLWVKASGRSMKMGFRSWVKGNHTFHWLWFALSVGIFGLHNYLVLDGFPFTWMEKMSAMLGRVLTGAVIVGLYWLACGLAGGLAPKRMRRWPWVVAACLPFVVLTDFIMIVVWKNPILNQLNQLDESGRFDLGANLVSSGVAVSPVLVVVGFFLIVWTIYMLCHWVADFKWASALQPRRWILVVFLLGLWGGVWAEKIVGETWKSRNAKRWEHNAYNVHLTRGFEPPLGVAEFEVTFFEKSKPKKNLLIHDDVKRPDIFIIMMESTRQDAIQAAHAPFLSRFRDEECQQLGETWAASNSTALSWYGLFHGVMPVFWCGDKASYLEHEELATPALFDLLHQAEYRLEVRTVCDLSYRSMGATSFGSDQSIFHAYDQSPEGEVHWKDYYAGIPKREKESFASALRSLQASPSSGNFHFIALDSTHYGYRWHEDFQVPYEDHYEGAGVPPFPNEEEIASIKRRYHNAVGWVDYQVEEFVEELKKMGRYDNSVIIVTGDHGEEFYENGSWFHSSSLMLEQTQVPLLVKWPKGTKASARASASHLDLVPSFYDLLEVDASDRFLGKSLLAEKSQVNTQVTFACNTGVTGVCMAWYREGYTATFRWENPFSYETPSSIHLDDIMGPDGEEVKVSEPEEWEKVLRERFPDAPTRLFSEFKLAVPAP